MTSFTAFWLITGIVCFVISVIKVEQEKAEMDKLEENGYE